MYARPMTPVTIGDVSAAGTHIFFRVHKFPVRVRDVAVSVDADFDISPTDYFILGVVRLSKSGSIEWAGPKLRLDSDGLKAYVWKEVLSDAGMRANTSYALRIAVGAGTPSLSGLMVSFTTEGRFDNE